MLEHEPVQLEGNAAVYDFLQFWLEQARKGDIIFCAAVFADLPTKVRTGMAGVLGLEFAVSYGLDELKLSVRNSIDNKKPPAMRPDVTADRVMYNLIRASCSYDFLVWLVGREMDRVREGAPAPLRVGFFPGRDGDMRKALNTPEREQHFHNVMLPLVELIGGVVDETAIDGRQEDSLSYIPVFEAYKRGEPLPTWKIPQQAMEEMDSALVDSFGQSPVTITLRESTTFPHRNSNLPEWLRFARWLAERGEKVMFVRDTAKWNEPLAGFACCPPASRNLIARAALYQLAKVNLFVGNGPAALAMFMDRPYLMFNQVRDDLAYWPNQNAGWQFFTGLKEGEQMPIARSGQRMIYQNDTFEAMCAAWLEHIEPIRAAA